MDKSMIVQFILAAIQFCIGFAAGKSLRKKEKPEKKVIHTDHKHGWLDIRDNPIPHGIKFLAYDGNSVDYYYSVSYNQLGQPVTHWDKKLITKWMPIPEP